MIKRVVAYGCSHAFGTEMSGRHDSTGSREFVFGNIVAKHFDVPFHRVAQNGNSNEGMVYNVIEHCEQGDLAIFSGIQLRRSIYHPMSDDDPIGPQHLTQFEVGTVIDERKNIPSWLHINWIKEVRTKEYKEVNRKFPFIDNIDQPHVPAIAEYFIGYRWEFLPLFLDYLQYYASFNAIARSRGAYPINFIFAESPVKLQQMLNFEGIGPHFNNNKGDPDYMHERMPHTLNTSKLYKDWLNDKTRICKGELSMMNWVLKQQNLPIGEFPDNRFGHLGKEQQPLIAEEIIKRCKQLGYE